MYNLSLTVCDSDAIISVVIPTQLVACLSPLPDHPDPFQVGIIRKAKATRKFHMRISRYRQLQTPESGAAIGRLAKEFCLPGDLLELFIKLIVLEWKFKGSNWENNKTFVQGVRLGYQRHDVVSEPHCGSFEDFIESLIAFLETENLSEFRFTEEVVTTSERKRLKRVGEVSISQNDLNQERYYRARRLSSKKRIRRLTIEGLSLTKTTRQKVSSRKRCLQNCPKRVDGRRFRGVGLGQ